MIMDNVVIGLLGSDEDNKGSGPERWEEWRPTVDLCRQEKLPIKRLELLHQPKHKQLAEEVAADIAVVSPHTKVRLTEVQFGNPWDFGRVYSVLHEFAVNYKFDLGKEEYFVHISTGTHVIQICLFLLTEAKYFPARLIQTSKPNQRGTPGPSRPIDLDLSKYDLIAQRFRQEQRDDVSFLKDGIKTRNQAFDSLIKEIGLVALNSPYPILLMGPTGVGKSKLANRIHKLKEKKNRVTGQFISVNCATLRGDTVMSALFGHEKGAFTGAVERHHGFLKMADKGTLFLDEISELGVGEQALLLQAIEEKAFWPIKGKERVTSDFHLIAGTNCNLAERVKDGHFRADLYARIKLWTYHMPALKDRPEDIEPNLDYELVKFSAETNSHVTINREAREKFLGFALSPQAIWLGNFRDLNAAVVRMATFAPSGRITTEVVDAEIRRLRSEWSTLSNGKANPLLERILGKDEVDTIDYFERIQLEEVMKICYQSTTRSEAGRILFNVTREQKKKQNDADRLNKYLERFGLEWNQIKSAQKC